jgi:F0F1-type ATP synthase epsilon subunit
MADVLLRFTVRTPVEVVVDVEVLGARVSTPSGHVGLRPRVEPLALAVEPGLVLLRSAEGTTFVGSAGGLLSCDGRQATLFTPLGVVGPDAKTVREALERALAAPGAELQIRATLDKLEGRILTELRRSPAAPVHAPRARK